MKNTIGIRREDMSKKGEKRTSVVPELAAEMVKAGHKVLVQPRLNPTYNVVKRAFEDELYAAAGAEISEDLDEANVIFGLKEIELDNILPAKTYAFFSHTHKGQLKNRRMLEKLVAGKNTVMDFELMTDGKNVRVITAFTYFAGYAGMIDTLWAYGKRMEILHQSHPFRAIPQSIEKEDLALIKEILAEVGEEIRTKGTPENQPPLIVAFLGNGKTSTGAQEIYNILGGEAIAPWDVPYIFQHGSRDRVYKVVLDVQHMYRLKKDSEIDRHDYLAMPVEDQRNLYFTQPQLFESNLDQYLPYLSIVMNCILWSPKYPRVITNDMMAAHWGKTPLQAIGDISCDPNGGVEFSRETWIDNPVFAYNPLDGAITDGFEGEGVLVMAVTNLPCEFSTDASAHFSENLQPYIQGIASADYSGNWEDSGLPADIQRSIILWKGQFTPAFAYMQEFLAAEQKV